jgi:hypothetical protein
MVKIDEKYSHLQKASSAKHASSKVYFAKISGALVLHSVGGAQPVFD